MHKYNFRWYWIHAMYSRYTTRIKYPDWSSVIQIWLLRRLSVPHRIVWRLFAPEELYVNLTSIFPSFFPLKQTLKRRNQFPPRPGSLPLQSTTSITHRFSKADIVKNIDKAPLPKSTIILEEKINKEIEEDIKSKRRTTRNLPLLAVNHLKKKIPLHLTPPNW